MLKRVCCLHLNTAGVIIGWVSATFSLISIFILILALCHLTELTKIVYNHMNEQHTNEQNVYSGIYIVASIYLTVNLINLIASAMLIIGTISRRHLWLLPWIINAGISLALSILYWFYFVSMAYLDLRNTSPISLGSATASVLMHLIVWFIILSLYKELQQEGREQQQLAAQTLYNGSNISFCPYKYRDSRVLREEYVNRYVK